MAITSDPPLWVKCMKYCWLWVISNSPEWGTSGLPLTYVKMSEECQKPTLKINEDVKCLFFYLYGRPLQSIPVGLAWPHGPAIFFPKLSQDMREGSGSYFYAESGKVFVGEWVNDLPKAAGPQDAAGPMAIPELQR